MVTKRKRFLITSYYTRGSVVTANGRYSYQPNDDQFLLYNGLMLHNQGSICTDAHFNLKKL